MFATQSEKKFLSDQWRAGYKDIPILGGCLSNFVCSKEKIIDAGDHTILMGRVVELGTMDGDPLLYFRGEYRSNLLAE